LEIRLNRLTFWLQQDLGIDLDIQGKLISSLIAILILWALHQLIVRGIVRRIDDVRTRYRWQKTTGYLITVIAVLLVGQVWFEGIQSIATYLGLLSAGIAIALRDVITDFLGWIYLLWRKPFEVGDRIQIGDHIGDVIDQGAFQFTLMEVGNWVGAEQSTGRLLYLPNSLVFRSVLANYTKGMQYIWNEIPVLLTFESNWEKAKQLLEEIAGEIVETPNDAIEERLRRVSYKYMIQQGKLTPIVYTSVKENGILLTLRYLTEPRKRRDTSHVLWESILRRFALETDIRFVNQVAVVVAEEVRV
jgi:small-conductance mechanosensitive channel